MIALPSPISTTISIISGIPASTLRLVGNDEIGLLTLSVLRGAQGDTAAGIGQLQQTIVRALTAGQRHRIQARIRVGGVPGVGLFPIEQVFRVSSREMSKYCRRTSSMAARGARKMP